MDVGLPCASCGMVLFVPGISAQHLACRHCGTQHDVMLFEAASSGRDTRRTRPADAADDEGVCLAHPQRRATGFCEQCGRFLCETCRIELAGRVICPECIDAPAVQEEVLTTQKPLVRFDLVALLLAFLGLGYVWFPVLSLAALVISLRYMRRPVSIVQRGRWRFIIASLVALAGLVLSALFWGLIFGSEFMES